MTASAAIAMWLRPNRRYASAQSGARRARTSAHTRTTTTRTGMRLLRTALTALLQPHARVYQRVADVGQNVTEDRDQGSQEDHRAHDGEILAVDGVYQEAAQARNAEERLQQQAAQEEAGNRLHRRGQDRNRSVLEDMAEQHRLLAHAFGAGRANVVLIDLVQDERAIEPHGSAKPADDADDHRQHHELPGFRAAPKARQRKVFQHLAKKILPSDDVDNINDAH